MAKEATVKKWVYLFHEGNANMRDLLGGKGAGLSEMTNAGLPVPPGFSISTQACNEYYRAENQFPEGLWDQTLEALRWLEQQTGKKFGDPANPLLVSVRSGAKFSMPGMMDTVLNLGLNEKTRDGLARLSNNERFTNDAYRRFIQMFGKIVLDIVAEKFEAILDKVKDEKGATLDTDLSASDLREVVQRFLHLVKEETGTDFPQNPLEQLRLAIQAVFVSWNNKRAIDYRNFQKIPHDLGTAVNVQSMAFGNLGNDSGSGVAFTRNPATGESKLYGEFLTNAQGEDVVAGIRTPRAIAELKDEMPEMYKELADIANKLEKHYRDAQDLEFTVERGRLYMLQTRSAKRTAAAAVKMAVDMAREGLITRAEAIQRVEPSQIEHLLMPRFDPKAKDQAVSGGRLLAKGLNASPGAATGIAVFDADKAEELGKGGQAVILVRPETNPDDVHGMLQAKGILTSRGGATSHAAVVARGLGKPCVAGCEAIRVDMETRQFATNGRVVKELEQISIDGTTGEVFAGPIPTIEPNFHEEPDIIQLLNWADEIKRLGVWANADYPKDAAKAVEFGAEGIGLCRTEHMFFQEERLPIMRRMILAAPEARRLHDELEAARREAEAAAGEKSSDLRARLSAVQARVDQSSAVQDFYSALQTLLDYQSEDFKGIFRAMGARPVVIRLLDPPLHEFLPSHEELLVEVTELRCFNADKAAAEVDEMIAKFPSAKEMREELIKDAQVAEEADEVIAKFPSVKGMREELIKDALGRYNPQAAEARREKQALLKVVESMREQNPMLGLRGCRLGLMYPEINEMQVRAILSAACELKREGVDVHPEIMIPLVGHVNEIRRVREHLERVVVQVEEELGEKVAYRFGTMIEVPRACTVAGDIAQYTEFFSFGTNDLTQTTFGISRDDAEAHFLLDFVERGILPSNPFQVLDRDGVGRLMKMAVEGGRAARPDLKIGICGEHGGEPSSVEFCNSIDLNYVSCSPFRVPIARLAAAQAALGAAERDK